MEHVTLKFKDGTEEVYNLKLAYPALKLIKASKPLSSNTTPAVEEHDRLDFVAREIDVFNRDLLKLIKEILSKVKQSCSVFWINPYIPFVTYVHGS